jgi:hypothetical protein
MKVGTAGLHQLLRKYTAIWLGRGVVASEGIRRELNEMARYNERFLWIGVGMILALYVAALGLIVFYRDSPAIVSAIFGGTGFSIAGLGQKVFDVWKAKSTFELLLALATDVDGAQLSRILSIMEKKLL